MAAVRDAIRTSRAPARILAVRRGWWLPGGHSRGVQIGVIMWLVAWVMPA